MKTDHLIRLVLAGFLSFQFSAKSVAQPGVKVIFSSSDFSVFGDEENVQDFRSSLANYSKSAFAISPMDGSSASGAQTISFGGGVFTGSGRLDVKAGTEHLAIAGGETSVSILFQITSPFSYHFTSSVSTVGDFRAQVVFLTLINTNGTISANATLPTNEYLLQAFMAPGTNTAVGSGTWSYALSLVPANIIPGRFSEEQKAAFYSQRSSLKTLAIQLDNFSLTATNAAERDALLALAVFAQNFAATLAEDYLDPLDTNYTDIPVVVSPPFTPLVAGGNLTALEAQDYNAWLSNYSESVGYSTALTTAINRAQGAAFDGNSYWDTAQMNAAVQFEAQLAYYLDQEPALRSNVVTQFAADGFPTITVTTNDAEILQMEIITNGLPAALLAGFTDLGTDLETVTNIQEDLLTTDPGAMTGSFPGSLVNTNLDSAAHTLAAGLRDASLMLINTSLLPGGQFRFDLPTEPGYSYTIQFTQNPANPSSWTTILSNTAASALLSFTNSSHLSTQAGFYRASHN